ncbi:MAG: prepilin-type N-terminal cleavage/methylation domain-containing protein [Anaerolineales bacterium]|nr:prepilin-type N-terminal cleavage/methylation domain-containing protein [Anaerolineales bacterium]MDZ7844607.1 prepilin-type N-terminal cleavage/methylation domain-containing protein [Anaerolineales bacterium]
MNETSPYAHWCSRKPSSLFNREGGFTLVEELVAVAVIGLGLVILVSMITTGVIGVRTVNNLVIAETLARSQSELIKNAPYQADPDSSPYPSVSPMPNYTVLVEILYWNENSGSFTQTQRNDGLQKINVTVSSAGEDLAQISSYKVDR